MLFDAPSNAAYPVSLRGPGATLEGEGFLNTLSPSDGGKSRSTLGRELSILSDNIVLNPRPSAAVRANFAIVGGMCYHPFLTRKPIGLERRGKKYSTALNS